MRKNCEKHPEIIIDGNGVCWKCYESIIPKTKKQTIIESTKKISNKR